MFEVIELIKKKINVEPIKAKDNEAVYYLIREILESYQLDKEGTAYTDPYLNQMYEFYQKEKRGEYWVLKKEGIIIGGIGIAPFGNYGEIAELQKYYIKEEEQGAGYGRLLFEKALSFAKAHDYEKLYIETIDRLNKANKIYKHYGFNLLEEPLEGSEHGLMDRWFILDLS